MLPRPLGTAGHGLPDAAVSVEGLMLRDLVSASLISAYTVIELPESINDLQGTAKVSPPPPSSGLMPMVLVHG